MLGRKEVTKSCTFNSANKELKSRNGSHNFIKRLPNICTLLNLVKIYDRKETKASELC